MWKWITWKSSKDQERFIIVICNCQIFIFIWISCAIYFITVVVKDGLIRRSWGYFNPYSYSYFNIKKFLSEEIPFSCNISSHVGIKKILSYIYNPLQISNWIPSRSKVARSKIIKYQIHSIIIKNKIKYKLLIINIYIKKNHRYVSKSLNSMKNLQRYIYNDIKRTISSFTQPRNEKETIRSNRNSW